MSDSTVRPTAAQSLPAQSSSIQSSSAHPRLAYPQARRSDHTDDYFGETVADPYRWLEDQGSPETRAFVDAQNALSRSVLDALPLRAELLTRLTGLWYRATRR